MTELKVPILVEFTRTYKIAVIKTLTQILNYNPVSTKSYTLCVILNRSI